MAKAASGRTTRYVCAVFAAALLALVGAGAATADDGVVDVSVGVAPDGTPSIGISWSIGVGPASSSGSYGTGGSGSPGGGGANDDDGEETQPQQPAPAAAPAPAPAQTSPAATASSEPVAAQPQSVSASPPPPSAVASAPVAQVVEESAATSTPRSEPPSATPSPRHALRGPVEPKPREAEKPSPTKRTASTSSARRPSKKVSTSIPRLRATPPFQAESEARPFEPTGSATKPSVCKGRLATTLVACARAGAILGKKDSKAAEARRAARQPSAERRLVPTPGKRPVPSSTRTEAAVAAPADEALPAANGRLAAVATAGGLTTLILLALAVAGVAGLTFAVVSGRVWFGAAPGLLVAATASGPGGGSNRPAASRGLRSTGGGSTGRRQEPTLVEVTPEAAEPRATSSTDVGSRVTAILVAAEEAARQLVDDAHAESAKIRAHAANVRSEADAYAEQRSAEADAYAEKRVRDARENSVRITEKAADEARMIEQEAQRRLEAEAARHNDLVRLSQTLQDELHRAVAASREPFDRLQALIDAQAKRPE